MLADNLCRAGLRSGCWLLEISIPEGAELARHTLNPQLGIEGGLSLLGTTGLVRPYSHEAYLATIRICVEGHAREGGRSMVFCTGGRTRKGAGKRLPDLPESAFVCIGDFIAESLEQACRLQMREIVVACMAGKLCKYAAGFRNTHAAKNQQDMALLRAEVRRCLPEATALHEALAHSVSVREALLSLPDATRTALLHRLAHLALEQFARHCPGSPALRLLVFDFDGSFLMEQSRPAGQDAAGDTPDALPETTPAQSAHQTDERAVRQADPPESVGAGLLPPAGEPVQRSGGHHFLRHRLSRRRGHAAPAHAGRRGLCFARPAGGLLPAPEGNARHRGPCPAGRRGRSSGAAGGGERIAVLASGDALYHGFGGTLSAQARPGDNLLFHPGPTAFQALFHRLGRPWQEARLFCVHSGEDIPARQIAQWPLTVTYAGSRHTADAIARAVLETHPEAAGRAAVMAERLGSSEERLVQAPLRDIAALSCGPTSLLVLLEQQADDPAQTALPPLLALGLPDTAYAHEAHLITAPDVRAVILSRLRLPHWGVLWDMGAGSGSVGLEAAALCPGLHVVGVERKAERVALMERNARRLGVANYAARTGEALALARLPASAPEGLPDPDRIFLGGGGRELPELLTACMERLRPGGLLAASSVTLQSFADLLHWSPEQRTGICRLDVAVEAPLARVHRHLSPQHTIHIFTFQKEAQA